MKTSDMAITPTELLLELVKLCQEHNVTGCGVILIKDRTELFSYQCGFETEDFQIAASLFTEFGRTFMTEH